MLRNNSEMFDDEFVIEYSLKCDEKNSKVIGGRQDRKIRRQIANNNERKRMMLINSGFESLRTLLPNLVDEKISKAALLQQAALYISTLTKERDYYKMLCQKLGFDLKNSELSSVTKKRKYHTSNSNCNNMNASGFQSIKNIKVENIKEENNQQTLNFVDSKNNTNIKNSSSDINSGINSCANNGNEVFNDDGYKFQNDGNKIMKDQNTKENKIFTEQQQQQLLAAVNNPFVITNNGLLLNYQLTSPATLNNSNSRIQQLALNNQRLIALPILMNNNDISKIQPVTFESSSLLSPPLSSTSSPSLPRRKCQPGNLDIIIEAINHVENKTRRTSPNNLMNASSSCNPSPNQSEESELDSDLENSSTSCNILLNNNKLNNNHLCSPISYIS